MGFMNHALRSIFDQFVEILTNDMRSVSFINHLLVKLRGKVTQNCIALGDVDDDSCNELLVATSGGYVQIFKGQSLLPWWELNGMGDVSCVSIGDVCHQGKHSVLVFTRNGHCSIIDICSSATSAPTHNLRSSILIGNIDSVLIGDIDNDGKQELVVCHSDTAVTAYRWSDKIKAFDLLHRWKLHHLPGNATLHVSKESQRPLLTVSQPGCSYAVLTLVKNDESVDEPSHYDDVQYTELSSLSRLQNPDILCKVLGNITKTGVKTTGYFALCTLDGTLKLIEENKILWSVQVDHQLFAMNKLDVLGDNREEVIVCAWDGMTYIVDHDHNVVRYQFQDNVQAFHAGRYSIDEKNNIPCFVYVDFYNKLTLYYDVKLPFFRATDLVALADSDDFFVEKFREHGLSTMEEKGKFLRSCLDDMLASKTFEKVEEVVT